MIRDSSDFLNDKVNCITAVIICFITKSYANVNVFCNDAMTNEKIFSIGRAGKYDYQVDIDDCIEQALDIKYKML